MAELTHLVDRIALGTRRSSMFDLGTYSGTSEGETRVPATMASPSSCPNMRMDMEDDEEQSLFLWRLDPFESHSDWSIILEEEQDELSSEEPVIKTFHVHKNLVGVGPFRAEYFARLFRQSASEHDGVQLAECGSSTSTITLRRSAIFAFSIMLDFIYSRGDLKSNFTVQEAVALRFLSTYFGVPKLYDAVAQLIQNDLTSSTCTTYLLEATAYHDDKLTEAACTACAENFEHIAVCQINTLSPDMLCCVIGSPHLQCESEELSCRIAEYCRAHPALINGIWLLEVTCCDKMPRIFPEEALFLLQLAVRHLDGKQLQQNQAQGGGTLKDRCIAACSEYWTETLLRTDTLFGTLPDSVKVELLLSALRTAGKELDTANSELDASQKRRRSFDKTVERLNHEIQTHKTISSIQERRSLKLEQQLQVSRSRADALQKEVQKFRSERENRSPVPGSEMHKFS